MQTAAGVISSAITKSLHGRTLGNARAADETLVQLKGEAPELNLGNNILASVSLGILKALARSKSLPIYKCMASFTHGIDVATAQKNGGETGKVPRLMLTCLRGGKAYGTKLRFSRFAFIYEAESGKADILKDVHALYAAVRKQLAAGKQGVFIQI